jgi:hypothetical protein
MPAAPYTRVLVDGIPYWRDGEGKYYYYESAAYPVPETRICLGSETTGLCADWQTKLAEALAAYRASQKARPRAAPAAKKS